MKSSEAPEKIYIHEASAPELTDKLPYHIEYTRTDAFIEKACEYLKCLRHYNEGFIYPSHTKAIDNFIEGFKKYMEECL